MEWVSWILVLVALGGLGFLFVRLRDEKATTQRLRNEHMQLADEIEHLKATQARLIQAMPMTIVGQIAAVVAHEVDPPLGFARSNVEGINELLDDYRQLVKNYDSAVQYCLQPVEMIFGADKAGLDQLVKHVEDARRQLFHARRELEKSSILTDSKSMLTEAALGLGRSSTLVHGLCSLTRPDADGVDATDVNQVLDAALGLLEPTWGDRIVIVREYGDLPTISCLPAQICRAFLHILENSATAISDRGRISVHTRAGGVRNVEIRISDTGSGIANEVLPEVFEPFFSTSKESLGLGLSTAQGIIKAHGGTINLRSSAETGTSVIVSLPITAATAVSKLSLTGIR